MGIPKWAYAYITEIRVPTLVRLPKMFSKSSLGYHCIQLDPQMRKRLLAFGYDHLGEVQTPRNPRSGT